MLAAPKPLLPKVFIYTLSLSSSRRQRILLKGTSSFVVDFDDDDDDATAPDRSIDRSFASSSFTSSSVFVFIESGKNDFSDWKD